MNIKIIGICTMILVLAGVICISGIPMISSGIQTPGAPLQDDHSDQIPSMKSSVNPNMSYEVLVPFPSTPEKIVLYTSIKPEITEKSVLSLAEKMDLEGTVRESHDQMLLSDDPYSLEVHMKSGRIALIDIPRWMNPNSKDLPSNLPSDEEAIEIASAYLEEKELMPSGATLCAVEHPQIIQQNEDGKITGIAYEEIQVSFCRKIDDLPVVGSTLTVEIGGGGDILNVYKLWRDYITQEEISIITPEEAFEELKATGIATDTKCQQTAEITSIELGYYEASAMDDQNYLIPVYIFEGEISDGKTQVSFVRYVPASEEFRSDIPEVK